MGISISIIASVAGGLGLFLLGMRYISEGLQAVAGQRMRKLVAAATTNRIFGVFTGAFVTGIIQASAVTTVMAVGLVSSGVMTLMQAVNVIIGANIGTTATAWLVSIFPKVGSAFGLGLTGVSALIYLFAKKESTKYKGLIFLGLGLIFYGLFLMNSNLAPLSDSEQFVNFLRFFEADSAWGLIKCIIIGAIATALVQSSSATTAVSISLAINGIITFDTAASLVLGMNIGTTVTAWLASVGTTTDARRATLAHTLFNLIGVALMVPFFLPVILPAVRFVWDIDDIVVNRPNELGIPIAAIHTAFNIVNTLIFLPFIKQFVALICKIIPNSQVAEIPRLAIFDPLKIAPVVAVEQACKEVERMALRCDTMLANFRIILSGEDNDVLADEVRRAEERPYTVQHEVSTFLGGVLSQTMASEVALQARMLLRVAAEYESVLNEGAMLLTLHHRIVENEMQILDRGRADLLALHDACAAFCMNISEAFRSDKSDAPMILLHMHADGEKIAAQASEIRHAQMMRLSDHELRMNPMCVVIVLDMINTYRRLKDDCLNVGRTILKETW